MIEIRIHGRGGQGAVIASEVLASAFFKEGKFVQAFPAFGVERRGAPVAAFTRVDDQPIRIRHFIYEPDHIIILDPTLIESTQVDSGLKENGWIIINTDRPPKDFRALFPIPRGHGGRQPDRHGKQAGLSHRAHREYGHSGGIRQDHRDGFGRVGGRSDERIRSRQQGRKRGGDQRGLRKSNGIRSARRKAQGARA